MTSFASARLTPAGLAIAALACLSSPALAQGRPELVTKQAPAAMAARGPAMGPPTAVIQVNTLAWGAIQVDSVAKFDGTGSTSVPPGHVLRYQWDFGDHGAGTGATVTHKYSAPSETCGAVMAGAPPQNPRLVTLVVTDGATQSVPATFRVRVCSGQLNPNYRRP